MKKLMLLTLSISSLCAMDNSKQVNSADVGFKSIKSVQDIAAFAGCVVAYKANPNYLGSDKGYSINADESVKYGYISLKALPWNTGEKGFKMNRLLKSTCVPEVSALTNDTIKKEEILMRHITNEELEKIKEAINNDKAYFTYINDKKQANAMLSGQEETYWQEKRIKNIANALK